MRYLILFTLFAGSAQAADLAPLSCINFLCFRPAPEVAYIGTDSTYSLAIASVNGVLYTGPTTSMIHDPDTDIDSITADLHSADGSTIVLTASFARWVEVVNRGRAHYRIVHLELLGGTLTL